MITSSILRSLDPDKSIRIVFSHGTQHNVSLFQTKPKVVLSEHVNEEPQGAIGHLESLRISLEFARYDALEDKVATASTEGS